MAPTRDLRIDFFRGVALLIVLVDHIEGWTELFVLQKWMLISLGFSDAAEIFVFLSGFVFAGAYARALERGGPWFCLQKALKRSLQIYVAYVLAGLTVITIGALTLESNPPIYNPELVIGERMGASILACLTLRFHPFGFDILAMYVPILPAMAGLLMLRRRAAWLAWAISGGIYLLVQIYPELNLSRFGDAEPWYFNPLAWQFLFFIGVSLGDPQRRQIRSVPLVLMDLLSIGMLLLGFFVVKVSYALMERSPGLWEIFQPMYQLLEPWALKTPMGPLRLLHFFALVHVTRRLLPAGLPFWGSRVARPVVISGQNSLEVYAFGLVLCYLGVFVINQGFQGPRDILVIDLAACVCSLAFGYVVRWWRAPVKATPPPTAPHAAEPNRPGGKSKRRRASKSPERS